MILIDLAGEVFNLFLGLLLLFKWLFRFTVLCLLLVLICLEVPLGEVVRKPK